MPSLTQLQALRAIAEAGSFSGAADALNYSQPAVSKTIATLERELGAVLVERQHRPVRLTDAGKALVRGADDVFERLLTARSEIEAISQADAGTVCVGTFSSAGAAFVVDALCEFRARHPRVEVSIVEGGLPSALVRKLRAGDLDLAVVFDFPIAGDEIGGGLELHHLLDDPFDLLLHPRHRLARAKKVRAEDIRDEDWLLPDFGPDSPSLKLITRLCAAAGFEPRVTFRVNDCNMTQAMVGAGEGIALHPRLSLSPLHAPVVVKALEGEVPIRRVSAVRLPTRYLTPAAAEFLAVLHEAAERYASSRQ